MSDEKPPDALNRAIEKSADLRRGIAQPPACWCGKALEPAPGRLGRWSPCEACLELAAEGAVEAMKGPEWSAFEHELELRIREQPTEVADLQRQLHDLDKVPNQSRHDWKQLRQAMGCDGSDLPQLLAAWDALTEENGRLHAGPEWSFFRREVQRGRALIAQEMETKWRNGVATAQRAKDKADLEVERLKAELGKYPVTGDGVRITPGMELWQVPGLVAGTALPPRRMEAVLVDDEGMLGEVEEYAWTFYAKDCYSTEAAAKEAAQAAEKKT